MLKGGYFLFSDRIDTINAPKESIIIIDRNCHKATPFSLHKCKERKKESKQPPMKALSHPQYTIHEQTTLRTSYIKSFVAPSPRDASKSKAAIGMSAVVVVERPE